VIGKVSDRRQPVETATLGKILVKARIENLFDVEDMAKGLITADRVRRIEIEDARVDTGATYLAMPKALIDQLALRKLRVSLARTASGMASFGIYGPVRLTIQGRDCIIEVSELADGCPVLVGVVPLEMLDYVVDPKSQRLIGNPEHGGEWMIDMYFQIIGESQSDGA
jgi:predicted aspartyl protease